MNKREVTLALSIGVLAICFTIYKGFELSQQPLHITSSSAEVGRYVIVHSPHVERNTILLDTATGESWIFTELTYVNGDPDVWESVPKINSDQDEENVVQQYGRKPKDLFKDPIVKPNDSRTGK